MHHLAGMGKGGNADHRRDAGSRDAASKAAAAPTGVAEHRDPGGLDPGRLANQANAASRSSAKRGIDEKESASLLPWLRASISSTE